MRLNQHPCNKYPSTVPCSVSLWWVFARRRRSPRRDAEEEVTNLSVADNNSLSLSSCNVSLDRITPIQVGAATVTYRVWMEQPPLLWANVLKMPCHPSRPCRRLMKDIISARHCCPHCYFSIGFHNIINFIVSLLLRRSSLLPCFGSFLLRLLPLVFAFEKLPILILYDRLKIKRLIVLTGCYAPAPSVAPARGPRITPSMHASLRWPFAADDESRRGKERGRVCES